MTVCPFGSPSENDEERSRSMLSPEQAAQNALNVPNAPSAQNVTALEIVRVYLFIRSCLIKNLRRYKRNFLDIECRIFFGGNGHLHTKIFSAQWHTPHFLRSILSFIILFQVSRINAVTKQQVVLDTGRTNFQVRSIKLEFLSLPKARKPDSRP